MLIILVAKTILVRDAKSRVKNGFDAIAPVEDRARMGARGFRLSLIVGEEYNKHCTYPDTFVLTLRSSNTDIGATGKG